MSQKVFLSNFATWFDKDEIELNIYNEIQPTTTASQVRGRSKKASQNRVKNEKEEDPVEFQR